MSRIFSVKSTTEPRLPHLNPTRFQKERHGLIDSFTEQAIGWIDSVKSWHAVAMLIAYFLAVFWLDHLSGDELVLVMLYVPVVAFATVKVTLGTAINLSIFCSIVWLADDVIVESVAGPTGNEFLTAALHFVCFVVIATVMSRLHVALKKEKLSARFDYLTGLPNMIHFNHHAQLILEDAATSRSTFSVAFIDCDNFKSVNDTYGHDVGDQLLQTVASRLADSLRSTDLVARYGGDEFVVLMPDTNNAEANEIMVRLETVLNHSMKKRNWPVTLSIGLASFVEPPQTIEQAIKTADELMYSTKSNSKNGVTSKIFDGAFPPAALTNV